MLTQASLFRWNKSMRLEAGTQMIKTDLFWEELFLWVGEAFICSQVKRSQGYMRVGQAVSDDSNGSHLGASLQGQDFKDIWVPEDADVYFKNRV